MMLYEYLPIVSYFKTILTAGSYCVHANERVGFDCALTFDSDGRLLSDVFLKTRFFAAQADC